MKNIKINRILCLAVMTAVWFLAPSCKDDKEKTERYVTVDKTDVYATKKGYGYDGETVKVTVSTNSFWIILRDENDSWLEPVLMAGSGETVVELAMGENTGGQRTAKLIFEISDDQRKEVTIYQAGDVELIEYFSGDMGAGAAMVSVNQFEQWTQQGVGSVRTQYSGEESFVDTASPSSGYDEASGGNNILFGGAASVFEMGPVDIKSNIDFTLYFGSMTTQAEFKKSDLKLYVSKDMENWTRLAYDRPATPGWGQVRFPFFIKTDVRQLYFRLECAVANAYRIDDFRLVEGAGDGESITFVEDDVQSVEFLLFSEDFVWATGGTAGFPGADGPNITTLPNTNGWEPLYAYSRAGEVKCGTSNDAGVITTPKIGAVGSTPKDIVLEFDIAMPYDTDHDGFQIVVLGAGTIRGSEIYKFTMPSKQSWEKMRLAVVGATSQTQLSFRSGYTSGEIAVNKPNRFSLDNVKIINEVSTSGEIIISANVNTLSFKKPQDSYTVTVMSNKIWKASSTQEWLTVMPGTGKYGTSSLIVTAQENNSGAVRNADVVLTFDGETVLTIPVVQTTVTAVDAPANLALLKATTTNVAVMWDDVPGNTRKYVVEIASSSNGTALQSYTVTMENRYQLSAFTFPKLMPATTYYVRVKAVSSHTVLVDSEFTEVQIQTLAQPTLGAGVVLYHNFDGCDWGGDHVLQTYGFRPTGVGTSTPADAEMNSQCNPNTGGSSNFCSITGAGFKDRRRIQNWTSTAVYEFPGYIKFGTGSAGGNIVTNVLGGGLDGTQTLKVSFSIGTWTERNSTTPSQLTVDTFTFKVTVQGGGTISGANEFTVTKPLTWEDDFSVTVNNATALTKLKFETVKVTGGTNGARCAMDNLLVEIVP